MRESRRGYPPQFLTGALRGNGEFPQVHAAQALIGGVEVINAIRQGQLTWAEFFNSRMSKGQTQEARQRLYKAHLVFGVPFLPRGLSKEEKRAYKSRHPKQRVKFFPDSYIKSIVDTDKMRIIKTACRVARGVVPKDQQPPSSLTFMFTLKTLRLPEDYNIPLLTLFFTDPAYKKQVDALQTMWQAAAESLHTPEGKAIGSSLREKMSNVRKNKASRKQRVEDVVNTTTELNKLVTSSLVSRFPTFNRYFIDLFAATITAPGTN